jgi:hypothetical protein
MTAADHDPGGGAAQWRDRYGDEARLARTIAELYVRKVTSAVRSVCPAAEEDAGQ